MSVHDAKDFGRVVRPDRCGCDEMPQLHFHTGRGASWFACLCGRVSVEAQDIEQAVYNWNQLCRRGA